MGDCRPKAQIPPQVFLALYFAMFLCRLPSFNDLEQHRGKRGWRRWLYGHDVPSADAMAYAARRADLEGLRALQGHLYARLKRNKVLRPRRGWMLAAIDGHEIFCSEHRCCERCCRREVASAGKVKVQFYHRAVVFQLLGPEFFFPLDIELVAPGEDEVGAALRLLGRVLDERPRCFDVLTADALYLRPSVLGLLASHGKHLIAVLKANQPELLAEARTLMGAQPPCLVSEEGGLRVEYRDMEGFLTESIKKPLRVVQADQVRRGRQRVAGQWQQIAAESHWFWATTMPASLLPTATLAAFGHARWKIENELFNELATHWHADHCFHHHPTAIAALWLTLFAAYTVFHCFFLRNLKPQARGTHSAIYFAERIQAEMRCAGSWWPPP
jgi:hypothetical protein